MCRAPAGYRFNMSILKSLFSSKEAPKSGPETAPVKMNLEERMAFRREMLYEAIKVTIEP